MRRMARVAPLSMHVDAWVTWLHGLWVLVWLTRPPHHNAPTLVLLRALTASALALFLLLLQKTTHLLPRLTSLDEALAVVATTVVLLLAARVAAAVQRWRLGNSDFRTLVYTARSIVLQACSFLSGERPLDNSVRFLSDLKRLTVAYVALAVDDCSHQHRPSVIADQLRDLLSEEELTTLHTTTAYAGNKAHAGVVELWLRCRVSHACFAKDLDNVLLPHAVQVTELQHAISSLPLLYDNVLLVWRDPPVWGYWTRHAPFGILGVLAFYIFTRAASMELRLVLWVFVWGALLFGLDSLAQAIENQHFTDGVTLHTQLLDMQLELHTCLHAYLRPRQGLESLRRHDRNVLDAEHLSPPASDDHAATSRSPVPHRDSPPADDLSKPSLKQVLDLITTDSTSVASPSTTASETAIREGERQPLLGAAPRPGLFLPYSSTPRIDGDASDATDEDEDADYASPA